MKHDSSLEYYYMLLLYKTFIVDTAKSVLSASCLVLKMKKFRCYEVKIEESEKASSRTQDTSGTAASALPLSHDSQTATNPHNPLYMLHLWY